MVPLFKDVQPSLLHGDLWSGNVIYNKHETPYLIDPAVYVGDSDVDIAMSLLFGDFGEEFYRAYGIEDIQEYASSKKIALYQLYYMLVHLVLFGRSYQNSVLRLLAKIMD